MKKIAQYLIVGIIAVSTIACGNSDAEKRSGAKKLKVEAYKVTPQSFNNKLTVTANLMAKEQVELAAPITGQVLDIYFKEGEYTKKGQRLIRLDDRAWKAQLSGVNAELAAAQKNYERKQQLLTVEGSSQEEIDNAFSKLQLLKSQQQQLQINIDLANVSAPFSGQLGMRNFSKGALLKQGDIVTTLSANQQLKVDFTIAQIHSKSIKLNTPVNVLVGNDTLVATVYAINPIINAKTRTLNVRAMLKQNLNKPIKPGTFSEVIIATEIINDAILIPTQAIVPSINEQTVYIAKNGKAVRKVVEMGNRNVNKVLINKGLSFGDTVITTGLLHIKEGMEVTIQAIK